jgi:hypothetical protein
MKCFASDVAADEQRGEEKDSGYENRTSLAPIAHACIFPAPRRSGQSGSSHITETTSVTPLAGVGERPLT